MAVAKRCSLCHIKYSKSQLSNYVSLCENNRILIDKRLINLAKNTLGSFFSVDWQKNR